MPLHKIAKFAEMTGKTPKDIHAYISQNKIVKTKEGSIVYIDTDKPINNAFLLKHQGKILENEVKSLEDGTLSTPKVGNGEYFLDVKRGMYLDIQIAKGKLDIEKKEGEVFPIQLVKELVMRQAKSITEAYKQHLDQFLDHLSMKFKVPRVEIVKANKEIAEGLNKAQLESIEIVKLEMKAIGKEYSVKKGVGEHE